MPKVQAGFPKEAGPKWGAVGEMCGEGCGTVQRRASREFQDVRKPVGGAVGVRNRRRSAWILTAPTADLHAQTSVGKPGEGTVHPEAEKMRGLPMERLTLGTTKIRVLKLLGAIF